MSAIAENLSGGLELVPVVALIPGLKALLIATVFSSFLVPTAIVLFVFSTPVLRRRPSFILNVCAIGFGLCQGTAVAYVAIREVMLVPPNPALISTITALYIVGPICVQTILFLRVLAAYPPHQFPVPLRFAMYGPAVALKAARVANACYLLYVVQSGTNVPKTITSESAAVWSSPFAKSELFLQLVDGIYVSTVFLLRIHSGVRFTGKQPRQNGPRGALSQGSYAARVRTLFWIALSNFVFPVIFDVAQLVLIFRDPNYVEGFYVISVNSYVSILGVLFSTIWASGSAARPQPGDVPSLRIRSSSHPNLFGTSRVVAGHLPPLSSRGPGRANFLHGSESLAVPPELKVRPSSRTDYAYDTPSADGHSESSDEHRLLFQPPLASRHPFAAAVHTSK
ncbi:hypothetical protein LXA43DRAFT_882068 [Ganoderma leucocontextum]|nr:hypothetical protein LXA43DRAFT_882068 [Ganoderma leucocontextum]